MRLTPELEGDAKAGMRLAFTRSCRNFPRLDMSPVHLALYQVYADVAYFIGSTFVLHDRVIAKEILGFTQQIQEDLLNKKENNRVALTFTQQEAKKLRGLTLGMTREMANVMVDFARTNPAPGAVQVRRDSLLTTRRNLLANQWTDTAIEAALARFKDAERGDGIAQSGS